MSRFSKISFKRPVRALLSTVIVAVFMVALIAASYHQNTKAITGCNIQLNDKGAFSYLRKKDIQSWLLTSRNINLSNHSLASLDLKKMETIAEQDPWVANAEIYVDKNRTLQIEVTQRTPTVRIFDQTGNSYYLDSTIEKMPLSTGYAFPATVFTQVPVYKSDSLNEALYHKIVYLSKVINADSFWKAQITQISVAPGPSFVAYTLLGDQKIILGDTGNLRRKLFDLLAFYQKVPKKVGWDTYQTLDLRFKGQVVAAPAMNLSRAAMDNILTRSLPPPSESAPAPNPPKPHDKEPEPAQQNKQPPKTTTKKQSTPKYIYKR